MALLAAAPRTATARAGTSVTLGKLRRSAFDHPMQTQPALRGKIWREFVRRAFDNLVRQDVRLSHLGDTERRAWFSGAQDVDFTAGQGLALAHVTHLAIVSGRTELDSETIQAPRFVALEGGQLRRTRRQPRSAVGGCARSPSPGRRVTQRAGRWACLPSQRGNPANRVA
jgi:hypothetical protein